MSTWIKAAGIGSVITLVTLGLKTEAGWGSILVLIAMVIALVKQLIAFIGFLTFAIKAIVVLAFIAVILGVGILVFRTWSSSRRQKEKS